VHMETRVWPMKHFMDLVVLQNTAVHEEHEHGSAECLGETHGVMPRAPLNRDV
jgi:hypothetical protein